MPVYETSVRIAAPVERVYAETVDISAWQWWMPTVSLVTRNDSGPIRAGSIARVRQPKLAPATWVVTVVEPDTRFCWYTDGFGYRMTADHVFEPVEDGTLARLTLTARGRTSPVVWRMSGRMIRRFVDLEAASLKEHCEGRL